MIYWEYAKIIAGSAVNDRRNYGFVNYTYKRLLERKINPSTILSENKQLFILGNVCAYCDKEAETLQWEHIIPLSRGGPDNIDNMVRACSGCNLTKGARDPYQWYLSENRDPIPRIVLGKFLKLIFDEYCHKGVIDSEEFMTLAKIQRITLSHIFSDFTT